jgi:hypothetical protein
MFGEMSVLTVIPSALAGRAQSWFASHQMPIEEMGTIQGWIDALKEEFKVNLALAREKAKNRKYTTEDKRVDAYCYSKLELLRVANEEMRCKDTIGELWLGLPPEFQMSLNFSELENKTIPEFCHILRDKDLSYRATMKNRRPDQTRQEQPFRTDS